MKIAIGTTSSPKVAGVQEAVAVCPYFKDIRDTIEYVLEKVPSDVSDMPLSLEVTLEGARNRAMNLRKKGIEADFYVGIEGGVWSVLDKKVLGGTIYIMNKAGEGHFGISQVMEVPSLIEKMLYEEGKELGPVMEALKGSVHSRSEEGSMGAWSDNMLVRKDEFSLAFKAAIAPFYNEYYRL
ncbi:MAG: inosine/xanthosine triphosphatase [Candidatus Gracilibacteria bacterium]|nr:inosine/xanthosine triphosphatase [Candidatus Gracilibacteria bacterium]